MKEIELRIGNIVMGFDGKPFEWTLQDFSILYNSKVDPNELCLPIPLTEEWLVKLGFTYDPILQRYVEPYETGNKYHVVKCKDGYVFRVVGCSIADVNSVHELQNVWYSLNKEELTL